MPHLVALRSHQVSTADGTMLYVTDYMLPPAHARGSVVLMHGLGEHSGRYRSLAGFFNQCGLSVRAYDHRGHGRSQGKRGDVINGDPMLQDAEIIVDDFSTRYVQPPFLFGHSMGGLFAARFALSRLAPLRGLILSSPALSLRLSAFQAITFKLMHELAPSIGVPSALPASLLSHDASVVAAYRADPLVHRKISARLLRSMQSSIAYCQTHAGSLSIPALMLVAGDDRLVDADGSRQFFAHTPPGMAEIHVYDGMFHEIFNEPDAHRPRAELKRWVEEVGLAMRFR